MFYQNQDLEYTGPPSKTHLSTSPASPFHSAKLKIRSHSQESGDRSPLKRYTLEAPKRKKPVNTARVSLDQQKEEEVPASDFNKTEKITAFSQSLIESSKPGGIIQNFSQTQKYFHPSTIRVLSPQTSILEDRGALARNRWKGESSEEDEDDSDTKTEKTMSITHSQFMNRAATKNTEQQALNQGVTQGVNQGVELHRVVSSMVKEEEQEQETVPVSPINERASSSEVGRIQGSTQNSYKEKPQRSETQMTDLPDFMLEEQEEKNSPKKDQSGGFFQDYIDDFEVDLGISGVDSLMGSHINLNIPDVKPTQHISAPLSFGSQINRIPPENIQFNPQDSLIKLGHHSAVYKGSLKNGQQIAVKQYILLTDPFMISRVKREISILQDRSQKKLPIPQFLGICTTSLPSSVQIITKWKSHFTLANLLTGFTKVNMPGKQKQILLRNICRAVNQLQQAGLSHNALNPSNIMLNNEFQVCLTGLSFCSSLDKPLHPYVSTSSLLRPRELYYSLPLALHYRTQELENSLLLKWSYSDLWSFGMIALDLFSDAPLFEGCQVPQILHRTLLLESITEAIFKKEGSCLSLRKSIYDLVLKCCSFDYGLKGVVLPSFKDILGELEALIAQR